jgi:hypothetical protein
MRLNYKAYPTDYVAELKRSGNRKKAMAFLDYWDDLEAGVCNAIGFYAKMWCVSKSTAHAWIRNFNKEIEKFLSIWRLRNQQHKKYAENSAERLPNGKQTKSASETTEKSTLQKDPRTAAERLPNHIYNIYDDDNIGQTHHLTDKDFNELFFVYRMNYKYAGKKDEAFREYLKARKRIDPKTLVKAAIAYLHDDNVQKKYNLTNFLKNEVYLSYLPNRFEVLIDGEWEAGEYDEDRELFVTDKSEYVLTKARLAELYKEGRLRYATVAA